ncbi:hypothetical protein SUGI_0810540 [Cryptomeria japonica]|nr:hypothetical protein SUGI_0810540 [Cryptomeria japonica]
MVLGDGFISTNHRYRVNANLSSMLIAMLDLGEDKGTIKVVIEALVFPICHGGLMVALDAMMVWVRLCLDMEGRKKRALQAFNSLMVVIGASNGRVWVLVEQ